MGNSSIPPTRMATSRPKMAAKPRMTLGHLNGFDGSVGESGVEDLMVRALLQALYKGTAEVMQVRVVSDLWLDLPLCSLVKSSLNFVSLTVAQRDLGKPTSCLASGLRRSTPQLSDQLHAGTSVDNTVKMSGRYAFANGLKELRFLFCQTGEHSSATRCVVPFRVEPN